MNEIPPVRPQITRTNTIRCTDDVIAKVDALMSVYGMTAYSEVWILALSVFYELLADATESVSKKFTRSEWNCMRDLFFAEKLVPNFLGNAMGKHLATIALAAHRVTGDGVGHFGDSAPTALREIASKLGHLSHIEAWAAYCAVMWGRMNAEKIDFGRDPWWTLHFRQTVMRRKVL